MNTYRAILQQLKIEHYIKNLIIFIPLILSHNFLNGHAVLHQTMLFLSFCMISSAVYIINDLKDVDEDRQHPYKKFRPIASGIITTKTAIFLIALLTVASLTVAYFSSAEILLLILCYLAINILYTFALKNIPYLDICCIAFGFILRIVSAFVLLDIFIDVSIIACTFFCSCFFTGIKRKLELKLFNKQLLSGRKILGKIKEAELNRVTIACAVLSVIFLFSACLTFKGLNVFTFIITLTYTLFTLRLYLLSNRQNNFDDPINFIKHDRYIPILLIFMCLSLVF